MMLKHIAKKIGCSIKDIERVTGETQQRYARARVMDKRDGGNREEVKAAYIIMKMCGYTPETLLDLLCADSMSMV